MFGFFDSPGRKMRENAANWLQLADKIGHYRRDQLTETQTQNLRQKISDLQFQLKQKADAGKLKLGIESLEGVLRQVGGTFYPKSALVENVEFFLVAAIIVLGVKMFFLQPFKIPTNSMWPTYHGMKGDNFPPETAAPGPLARVFRFVALGAQRRAAVAPADGEISAQFFSGDFMAFTYRHAYKWLVIPTLVKEYTFFVNGARATVQVPADFSDFDQLMQDTLFGGHDAWMHYLEDAVHRGDVVRQDIQRRDNSAETAPAVLVKLGRNVRAGTPIVRFDILTGDCLFVDRLSYHFVRPRVGDGFVFRTENIRSPNMQDRTTGAQIDQYYIKRLVGTPGDQLKIHEPVLYRNDQPITGASAFAANARRQGKYRGYVAAGLLAAGNKVVVPPRSFFAMGDYSGNSEDSRFWGFVPEKDVVGRPLFIYYPLTRRWGLAR